MPSTPGTDHLCPGILHAVPAKDGLLLRVRLPGGLITAGQFDAVASAAGRFCAGAVDITARANLQLRGVAEADLPLLVETLRSADLIPSALHERIRNISASPFAGWDPQELVDARPLVRELDQALMRDPELGALPPKFCFSIHGGGQRFHDSPADLRLHAVKTEQGIRLHLSVGKVATGMGVAAADAAECLATAARACLAVARELGISCRGRAIAHSQEAISALLDRLSRFLSPCAAILDATIAPAPVGVLRTASQGVIHIVPSAPLGRISAAQGRSVARIANHYNADLRLAPWRGMVLAGVSAEAADEIVAELRAVGLSCDDRDGYYGLAACVGTEGCASSHADVRAHAAELAQRLIGLAPLRGQTINFSGCEKRCAMRSGATVELVADPSGYNISIGGNLLHAERSPESAISLAVSSLRALGHTNHHESQLCEGWRGHLS